ncbi:MAG: hypothetical protein WC655_24275, partial [Candidatus Hydrogenedentales bacterium]
YPYEWYYGQANPDIHSTRSYIDVVNVGGRFWFGCGAGICFSHVLTNPTAYRYEQHSAYYLISEEIGGVSDIADTSALLPELCETQNSGAAAPVALVANLGGDPVAASTNEWHITYPGTSNNVCYYSEEFPGLCGSVVSNSTLPKIVVRDDLLYVIYQDTQPKYRVADLSVATPAWSAATQIASSGSVKCVGVSDDGLDLFTVLGGGAESTAALYKNSTLQSYVAEITSGFFFGDKLGVKSTDKCVLIIEYGIEDNHGDIDYYTAIASQP